MKVTIIQFIFFFSITMLNAQTKRADSSTKETVHICLAPIIGVHFTVFNNEFDRLNTTLSNNGYPKIYPAFNAFGLALVYKTGKYYNSFEFSTLRSSLDDLDKPQQFRLIPQFNGIMLKSVITKKLWEKKKLSVEGGLGLSMSKFNFKLIDKLNLQIPFDSLIKSPASASLDYAQKNFNWNIEGRFGLTYNTNWFKKYLEAYELSFYLNYSQTVVNSGTWIVDGINIKIPNFPNINFSNIYFQFANRIYFKRK